MAIYSYIRISTLSQKTDRQEYVLEQQGIKVDKHYIDKVSGKKEYLEEREALKQLKKDAKAGDIIYVESISRLARDLTDTIEICDFFKEKGVKVRILKESIHSDAPTYKLMVAIHGAIAEMERDTIVERSCQRTKQLVDIYRETGKIETKSGEWYGRKKTTRESILEEHPKFEKYLKQVNDKVITKGEMATLLGIGRTSLYKYLDLYYAGDK